MLLQHANSVHSWWLTFIDLVKSKSKDGHSISVQTMTFISEKDFQIVPPYQKDRVWRVTLKMYSDTVINNLLKKLS